MKRLIYFLITLLGFGTACSVDEPNVNNVAPAYAPLRCNFTVKARVVNEAGQAIPGIKVTCGSPYEVYLGKTDENGVVDAVVTSYDGLPISVLFDDVDGEANGGEFEGREVVIVEDYVVARTINLGDVELSRVDDSATEQE